MDRVTPGQVFRLVLWFSPVSVIPPGLHPHLHLHVVLPEKTNGLGL